MPVFAAFGSYFCLSKTFTFPRTLRRAEHQNLTSIFTVKLFFSGPRIRIIAEDNANAEDAVTYRCNTQVLKHSFLSISLLVMTINKNTYIKAMT